MKTIIFILSAASIALSLGNIQPHSPAEHASQDKQAPIIDEIFRACGPVLFPSGSSEISDENEECLLEINRMLQHALNYHAVIDGHRDSSERKGVSFIRANNARDYLVKHNNLDSACIIVRDCADTCPHESKDKERES